MATIITPEDFREDEKQEQNDALGQINYSPTDNDEYEFFLVYHLKLQPSEIAAMDVEKRKWMMARFMAQKEMEREMVNQQRMMQVMQNVDLTGKK